MKFTSKSCVISFVKLSDGFDDNCASSSTKLTMEPQDIIPWPAGKLHGDSVKMFPLCGDKGLDDVIDAPADYAFLRYQFSSKTIDDLLDGSLLHAPAHDLHHIDDLSKEQVGPRSVRKSALEFACVGSP